MDDLTLHLGQLLSSLPDLGSGMVVGSLCVLLLLLLQDGLRVLVSVRGEWGRRDLRRRGFNPAALQSH